MSCARRIVDNALRLEAEGVEPGEAFASAVALVGGAPESAVSMAGKTLNALARRAGRTEVVLPDRSTDGRFVATDYAVKAEGLVDPIVRVGS